MRYCMIKAALAMMTQALARDLSPAVRVNGVAPGAIPLASTLEKVTDQQQPHRPPAQSHGLAGLPRRNSALACCSMRRS